MTPNFCLSFRLWTGYAHSLSVYENGVKHLEIAKLDDTIIIYVIIKAF